MKGYNAARKVVGPGYVRAGPVTFGCFGVGCLLPTLAVLLTIVGVVVIL